MSEAILVVDDDAPIRRMLERTLTAEGYRVATAVDGGAALATIEQSVPDLVVLDLGMPGVDGFSVCRRARARGLATPILLLTARDALSDRVGCSHAFARCCVAGASRPSSSRAAISSSRWRRVSRGVAGARSR